MQDVCVRFCFCFRIAGDGVGWERGGEVVYNVFSGGE